MKNPTGSNLSGFKRTPYHSLARTTGQNNNDNQRRYVMYYINPNTSNCSINFIASYRIKNDNVQNINALDIANSLESLLKALSHIETMNDQNLRPYVSGMLSIAARECSALVTLLNAGEVNQ